MKTISAVRIIEGSGERSEISASGSHSELFCILLSRMKEKGILSQWEYENAIYHFCTSKSNNEVIDKLKKELPELSFYIKD